MNKRRLKKKENNVKRSDVAAVITVWQMSRILLRDISFALMFYLSLCQDLDLCNFLWYFHLHCRNHSLSSNTAPITTTTWNGKL